jgi:predicted metal-dependent phosphoesterase TrpH
MRSFGSVVGMLVVAACAPALAQTAPTRWFKGNTHAHTLNSDGDSTPDEVVRWYRERDYQFLVLTDHNVLTAVDALNALHGADERFLVIKGEEVTDRFGDKPLHVNGLDVARKVGPQGGTSVADVLNRNVRAIRRERGVPHINHPNFGWAITREELQQVRDTTLFEVFNGHPAVNNEGGGGVPALEDAWDAILSSGVKLYGIAVDDAHTFKQPGNPDVAGPGRGWVVVRSARLEARALLEALERGEFYASTGVELEDVEVSPARVSVRVKARPSSKYRIQFIGKGGRLLQESLEPTATYEVQGSEGYVRARVLESNGRRAWLQPVMLARPSSAASASWSLTAVVVIAVLVHWRRRSARRVRRFGCRATGGSRPQRIEA